MNRKHPVLTAQELEIMKLVWNLDEATVRNVYEALLARRKIAYTTVMTMMGTLEKKGHLTRRQRGRAYVYRPVRSRSQVLGKMARDFVDRVFEGSARPLLAHLVRDRRISEEDLEEIRRLIREEES
jgi:BlaI family transcriptional regulator, penicillinase repressor